jgi:hypothetical protein
MTTSGPMHTLRCSDNLAFRCSGTGFAGYIGDVDLGLSGLLSVVVSASAKLTGGLWELVVGELVVGRNWYFEKVAF